MRMLFQNVLLVLMVSMFSACASLTKEDYQRVQVETYSKDNTLIDGARCRARNGLGEWATFSSGVLTVHRSSHNLMVTCEKEGEPTGYGTLVSRINDGMVGNVIFGAGVGTVLDHHNGNGYSYPDWVRVVMGDNLVFDRRANKSGQAMTGVEPVETPATNGKRNLVDSLLYLLP